MIRKPSLVLAGLFLVPSVVLTQDKPPGPSPAPSPAASASPAAGTPTFPSQVELVTVDLVATDKKGIPVSDLSAADFTVTEDGDPQTIASFEAIQLPAAPSATPKPRPRVSTNTEPEAHTGRTFVIVFDDIHLAPPQAHRAKMAVAEFLKSGVREGDRVTLVSSSGTAWWSTRMEAGREELMTLLKRLDGRFIPDMAPDRMSDYEAMRIHVFHDTQVAARVSRRFDTYGVTQRMGGSDSSSGSSNADFSNTDPLVEGKASEVYFQSVTRNRITLQVLERVLTSLASTKGRKSLVLVSEGFIYDPNLDEFKRAVQASRRSNVAIYFLDTRGLQGMPDYFTAQFGPPIDTQDIGAAFTENLEASEGSESLSADTGGFTVKNTNDLGKGIQRIADESRIYYLLGYNSTHTVRDGKYRKIDVKLVARKGLVLHYRKGYYAPMEGGKSVLDRKAAGPGDPDIQAALDSPYSVQEIPLRMSAYVFDETILGKASAMVATDVDVSAFQFQDKDGRALDTLEFLLVVAHRESGEYFRYDQKVDMKLLPATRDRLTKSWFPVVRDFELAPGGYQAKIVVRDKNSGRIGSVVHEFDVPDITQFRVSTPVLSDALQQQSDPKAVPRPALLARRTFASGVMLYAQFDVYGAVKDKATGMPKVTAGYVIRRLDGNVQTIVNATPIKPTSIGKLSRLVGTRLEGAEPGDYEFVLTVRDEVAGKTLELNEPFTLTAAAPAPPSGS